jgi:hypothetical protein
VCATDSRNQGTASGRQTLRTNGFLTLHLPITRMAVRSGAEPLSLRAGKRSPPQNANQAFVALTATRLPAPLFGLDAADEPAAYHHQQRLRAHGCDVNPHFRRRVP